MTSSRKRLPALLATVLTVASLSTAPASAAEDSADSLRGDRALIRYTEHGIPHILAKDFNGLGYGYGYAISKDNFCELANGYLTLEARRSAVYGPGGAGDVAMSDASTNLTSDLHFRQINDSGVVERLVAQPAPLGPRREVRDIVSGYVQGYNRYLAEKGPDGIADPACHGAKWLRPITDLDVYRNVYAITTTAGLGAAADEIVNAKPAPAAAATPATPEAAAKLAAGIKSRQGDGELGSNGIAVGSAGTAAGSGSVLLGNPHYPWQGARRFWQSQLTIPGKLDVSGGGLFGIPLISIGHTANAAWTHTVSTAVPLGLFEVPLVPGDQTSYVVDGKPEKMTSRTVGVEVKQPSGELELVKRTLYATRYGPVVDGYGGTPMPWTAQSAHALRDANATNMRVLNAWFDLNRAQSTDDLSAALKNSQGLPWVNTMGTDRAGNALYSDVQVVPHVTDQQAADCGTPLGRLIFPRSGLSILDGSKTACAWGSDPDSIEPGLFSPSKLPQQQRRDYELNANDSAWLANAQAPITGYPRIAGDIGTTRSARTREALITMENGIRAGGFTTSSMKQTLFNDHSRVAELAAADTAKMCAAFPGGKAPSSQGPVDVGASCAALASWDHRYTLDSRGSLLFQRFGLKLNSARPSPWSVPFDPAKPLTTPNTLNIASPAVQKAFGDSIAELNAAGIPLDGQLGDNQTVTRNGERIPIHGGPHALGVLNVVTPIWQAPGGNVEIVHGTSYVQVVGLEGKACPDASTLLTYSQSTDPTSPYFSDQTKKFSRGEWVRGRFCSGDILSSPALKVLRLR